MSRVPNGTPWNTWGTFENDLDHTRLTPAMLHAYKVFLATAYPQSELVRTMKHLLVCLAFCASLSASAQGDNCTVLGIQDLTQMVIELKAEIDSLKSTGMTRDSVADIAVGVAWRGELAGANLSSADLTDAYLPYADLTDANLTDADLSNANLRYASLSFANLSNADLYSADLTGADLIGADLTGADLRYAKPNTANLTDANLTNANLFGANLFGASLFGADLTGASLTCLFGGCPSALPSG